MKDIAQGPYDSDIHDPVVIGDTLYFVARDPFRATGDQLWKSDGTGGGTKRVKRFTSASSVIDLTAFDGKLLFFVVQRAGMQERSRLWVSDGTSATTRQVAATEWLAARHLTPVGGRAFFVAYDARHGGELWRTDGTAGATKLVKDIKKGGSGNSDPSELTDLRGTLVFVASATGGRELWRSDGTAGGTVRIRDIRPDGSSSPTDLVVRGSRVYFSANDGSSGRELWRTNGTSAGTKRVKDIRPGGGSSSPHGLTSAGDIIAFAASDGEHAIELWQSDGTSSGTVLVADVNPVGSSLPASDDPDGRVVLIRAAGGRFYANAEDAAHGRELWTWSP